MAQLRSTERSFFFFECEIVSAKVGASIPTMATLLGIWKAHKAAGTAKLAIRNSSANLLIGDISEDAADKYFTALVRLSDSLAPDVVYSDIVADTFIEHRKAGKQGNDLAAHVMISIAPERGKPNVYFAMVEQVPGLSFAEIRRLLNRILRYQLHQDATPFKYSDPHGKTHKDGSPVVHQHLPRLEFRGIPSANFAKDLQRGKLTGVSLIRTEEHTPVAGIPYLTKKETELRLAIDRGNVIQNKWDDLKAMLLAESRKYPQGKIQFKLPEQNRSVSILVDSKTGAPLSEVYIQSILLRRINPILSYSSKTIVKHLIDLAQPHLISGRSV
jgi:hypothetical protein